MKYIILISLFLSLNAFAKKYKSADLFNAILHNDEVTFKKIIQAGLKNTSLKRSVLNIQDKNGINLLMAILQQDRLEMMKFLLEQKDHQGKTVNLDMQYKDNTPLLFLIKRSINNPAYAKFIPRFINETDKYLNVQDQNGYSALMYLVLSKSALAIEQMIDKKANINLVGKDGKTALIIACERYTRSIIRLLLDNKANINIADNNGMSPLMYLLKIGSGPQLIMNYLDEITNYNQTMKGSDINAFYLAMSYQATDILDYLLAKENIHFFGKNTKGINTLHLAAINNLDKYAKLLIGKDPNKGEDSTIINLKSEQGFTPMMYAALWNSFKTLKILKEGGAKLPTGTIELSSLTLAILKDHIKTFKYLYNAIKYKNIKKKNQDLIELFFFSLSTKANKISKYIIEELNLLKILRELKPTTLNFYEIKVEDNNPKEIIAHPYYIQGKPGEIEEYLINSVAQLGMDEVYTVLIENNFQYDTALLTKTLTRLMENSVEISNSHSKIFLELINHTDFKLNTNTLQKMFLEASLKGDLNISLELLDKFDHQLLATSKDAKGKTPLINAVLSGNPLLVDSLLGYEEIKKTINDKDMNGNTALLHATLRDKEDTALILINAKADLTLTNNKGITPLMYAAQNHNYQLVELIVTRTKNYHIDQQSWKYNWTAARFAINSEFEEEEKIEFLEFLLELGANLHYLDIRFIKDLKVAKFIKDWQEKHPTETPLANKETFQSK